MIVLLTANTAAAVAGIVFAVIGGVRPSAEPTDGERFYGWMYAVRGVPLGVAAGVAPIWWPGAAGSLILYAAAAAQAGDATVGIVWRKWTMISGAAFLTAVHVATAIATR